MNIRPTDPQKRLYCEMVAIHCETLGSISDASIETINEYFCEIHRIDDMDKVRIAYSDCNPNMQLSFRWRAFTTEIYRDYESKGDRMATRIATASKITEYNLLVDSLIQNLQPGHLTAGVIETISRIYRDHIIVDKVGAVLRILRITDRVLREFPF